MSLSRPWKCSHASTGPQPGPPVDAARLQPDNQAAQHIENRLVGAWLDDPELAAELAEERERLQRLQADEELLLALQLHQFTGGLWDRFVRELSRYGLGVLRAWIRHGTIYGKAKALTGYGLGRIEGWPDSNRVRRHRCRHRGRGMIYFRDKVLMTHRWQASAIAGHLFHRPVPLPVRQHLHGKCEPMNASNPATPMAELPEDWFDIIKGIEETIVANDTVAEAMALLSTDRARQDLFMQEHGFSQREIADELSLPDAKSVENLIGYQLVNSERGHRDHH